MSMSVLYRIEMHVVKVIAHIMLITNYVIPIAILHGAARTSAITFQLGHCKRKFDSLHKTGHLIITWVYDTEPMVRENYPNDQFKAARKLMLTDRLQKQVCMVSEYLDSTISHVS